MLSANSRPFHSGLNVLNHVTKLAPRRYDLMQQQIMKHILLINVMNSCIDFALSVSVQFDNGTICIKTQFIKKCHYYV